MLLFLTKTIKICIKQLELFLVTEKKLKLNISIRFKKIENKWKLEIL